MSFWKRVLSGCTRHEDIRDRDHLDQPILRCQICGDVRPMLTSEVVIGPKHTAGGVLGACQSKAKKVRADNVREWKRSER